MHTRVGFPRRLVASTVGLAVAAVGLSTTSAAADHEPGLVWLSRHTEPDERDDASASASSLTPDGRYALFTSTADGIVPEDDDGAIDAFISDLDTGGVTLVSTGPDGGGGSQLTDDAARFVEWDGDGQPYLRDVATTERRAIAPGEEVLQVTLSADGSTLLSSLASPEWNTVRLVLEHVESGARTELPAAAPANPQLAADGSVVVFSGAPAGAGGRPLLRWSDGTTTVVSDGPDASVESMSRDASVLAFWADDMLWLWSDGAVTPIQHWTDQVLRALVTPDGSGLILQVLTADGGVAIEHRDISSGWQEGVFYVQPDAYSKTIGAVTTDADGSTVAFVTGIHPDGPSAGRALWVHDRHAGATSLVCCSTAHTENLPVPGRVLLSADGGRLVFDAQARLFAEDPDDEHRPEVYALTLAPAPPSPGPPIVRFLGTDVTEGSGAYVQVSVDREITEPITIRVSATDVTSDASDWRLFGFGDDVTIPVGERAGRVVAISALSDDLVEPTEQLRIDVVSIDGAVMEEPSTVVDIVDVPPPTVSIGDVTRPERNSQQWWSFPVSLSAPTYQDVAVTVETRDATATSASGDYRAKRYTVTVPAGETSTTADIKVFGDHLPERDETFEVVVTSVVGGAIGDDTATGSILDDDTPAPLRLV